MNTAGHRARVLKGQRFAGVHPDIVAFYWALQKELQRRNMPFIAFEFVRSSERQQRLYEQGRTKAKPGQSPHNHGLAVDIVHSDRYWDLTRKEWAVIGAIGKEAARKLGVEIEWGGDWSFYDPAHWQIKDWRLWLKYRGDRDWPGYGRRPDRDAARSEFKRWRKKARAA